MKKYVLNSYALLAYCEGEASAKQVATLFKHALNREAELYLCAVNWGEMYYIALRECGAATAELYAQTLESYPIKIVAADKSLTLQAAQIKAHYRVSYAGAYAAALALLHKAVLVTGDNEFAALEDKITIQWL